MRFFLRCWIPALLSIGCVSQAQKNCAAEAKLLLVASQTKTAVTALNAGKKRTVQIYFFDTSSLNLMSQGVILRLRRGAAADLTVKLRLPTHTKTDGIPGRHERYKCEDDVIGGCTRPLIFHADQVRRSTRPEGKRNPWIAQCGPKAATR